MKSKWSYMGLIPPGLNSSIKYMLHNSNWGTSWRLGRLVTAKNSHLHWQTKSSSTVPTVFSLYSPQSLNSAFSHYPFANKEGSPFIPSTTHWSSLFLSVTQSPATSRQNCHWLQSYQIKASGHLSEQLLSATEFRKSLLDIILLCRLPASHCTSPRCSKSGGWFAPVHSDLLPGFSGFTAEELLFGIPSGQFIHPPPSRKT